jgi:hypothetical protein
MKVSNMYLIFALAMLTVSVLHAEDVKVKNAKNWTLTGRVQMQHLYNSDIESNAAKTNQGFRMRRVRIQTSVKMNDWVSGKIQFDIRDNNPVLKDAEGKIKLFGEGYFRFGQFKAPVWREEFKRSSGKLLLVERSAAASFLEATLLSGRHVGIEVGGDLSEKIGFAVNYSNGAGAGVRETAGTTKSDEVNNGKLLAGRLDAELSDNLALGISAVRNVLGKKIGPADNTGAVTVVAPDFAFKKQQFTLEGGVAIGTFSKDFLGTMDDVGFTLFDITGHWMQRLATPNAQLGGLDGVGFAVGYSRVDPNGDVEKDETGFLRFGPEVYFGKNTRLQINGELEMPSSDSDSVFSLRSQLTVNL